MKRTEWNDASCILESEPSAEVIERAEKFLDWLYEWLAPPDDESGRQLRDLIATTFCISYSYAKLTLFRAGDTDDPATALMRSDSNIAAVVIMMLMAQDAIKQQILALIETLLSR